MDDEFSMEVSKENGRGMPPPVSYMVPVVFDKHERCPIKSDKGMGSYACIIADSRRPELEEALESLGHVICYSSDGRNLPDHIPDGCDMVFVCETFEGEAFDYLHSRELRILGPPCVFTCSIKQCPLPNSIRPIYSSSMEGVVICFTGFKSKDDLHHLCSLAHLMGASIRKDMVASVTHIVAHAVNGSKYKIAVARGTPIMSDQWITECWSQRENPQCSAVKSPLSNRKQKPFTGCSIALYGFSLEEEEEMKDVATDNGSVMGDLGEPGLTHLVVSDNVDPAHLPGMPFRIHVVKQQWFWESIQIEACADEQLYQAKEPSHHHSQAKRRRGHPSNTSFLQTSISSMDVSSLLEASLFSLSSPMTAKGLGRTKRSPGFSPLVGTPTSSSGAASSSPSRTEDSARRHIASELLQTEKNFVNILNIVVEVFKDPLERLDQRGGPLLSHEDIKSVFGNIPEILSVHRHLVAGLEEQLENWSQGSCIGQVVLKQSDALLRVYPPFVNFFDLSKETLQKCDKMYPRFHAFLKSNESRPECGRQTLAELLITPVQRIPRIILLLKDLLKRTTSSHPDYSALQKAVESLKTVMNHINEDRRKTEGQMQMFEVLRDVEGCPANILSSQRSFLRRLDVLDIGNPGKGMKGDPLSIFIFSDSLEVAKRRIGTGFGLRNSTTKQFKHLEFIPLSNIRSVIQFGESGDYSNSFGILMHCLDDPVEKLLVFRLAGEGSCGPEAKAEVVHQLARLLADSILTTNTDQFIVDSSADILNSLCKTSVSSTSIKRALHGARKKVRRAFSGRHGRKSLSSTSVHQNLHGIGEENELPFDLTESPNTSMTSTTSTVAFATPVASLRTPRPKRPALSRLPSFSAVDLTNLSTEV